MSKPSAHDSRNARSPLGTVLSTAATIAVLVLLTSLPGLGLSGLSIP